MLTVSFTIATTKLLATTSQVDLTALVTKAGLLVQTMELIAKMLTNVLKSMLTDLL